MQQKISPKTKVPISWRRDWWCWGGGWELIEREGKLGLSSLNFPIQNFAGESFEMVLFSIVAGEYWT